ncbi:MAG: hypothetical protein ABIA37_00745 [Candidatus Woesearchaeota archaeon]
MKPNQIEEDKKKKKKKKLDEWEIDEGSDFPVHEKYVEEKPVKS